MSREKKAQWLVATYAAIKFENIDKIFVREQFWKEKKFEVFATEVDKKIEFGGSWENVLLEKFDTLEKASAYIKEVMLNDTSGTI